MQFMDLTVNGVSMFVGEPCFDRKYIGAETYLPYSGGFLFADMQGTTDPVYTGLDTRYLLFFVSAVDGSFNQIPIQAVPSQSLTCILDSQNIAINLYEEVIETTPGAGLPTGAGEGYIRQQFLSTVM